MTDLIAKASKDAKKAALKEVDGGLQNLEAAASAQVDTPAAALGETLDNLPLDIDPDLLLREKEAELLDKKAELDRLLLVEKDELVEDARSKLSSLSIPSNPFPIKLPPLEPKILARVAMLRAMKEIRELRKKISKENIVNGMTLYSYPINRKKQFPPTLPELPSIPDLPKLPSPPTLPPSSVFESPPPPNFPTPPALDNLPVVLTAAGSVVTPPVTLPVVNTDNLVREREQSVPPIPDELL